MMEIIAILLQLIAEFIAKTSIYNRVKSEFFSQKSGFLYFLTKNRNFGHKSGTFWILKVGKPKYAIIDVSEFIGAFSLNVV